MKPHVYLRLGRVSNLPTVWTDVAAGAALGVGHASISSLAVLAVALSASYVGGMFLNDAFDHRIDAVERPERPIPSGEISAREVFAIGFGLLVAAVLVVAAHQLLLAESFHAGAIGAAVLLGALIVLYDAWHKQNPLSPVVMGLCRGAVYLTAALATGGQVNAALGFGAASLVAYICGLTSVARYETSARFRAWAALPLLAAPVAVALGAPALSPWAFAAVAAFCSWTLFAIEPLFLRRGRPGAVPRAVGRMIAGVCLLDGMLGSAYAAPGFLVAGVLGLVATMGMQRLVRGT